MEVEVPSADLTYLGAPDVTLPRVNYINTEKKKKKREKPGSIDFQSGSRTAFFGSGDSSSRKRKVGIGQHVKMWRGGWLPLRSEKRRCHDG